MNEPEIPPLFAACDGLKFYDLYARRASRYEDAETPLLYTIRAGVYPTGNGALVIVHPGGEVECKITVNLHRVLAPEHLSKRDDEFYVKVHEVGQLVHPLLKLGFFAALLERVCEVAGVRVADLWQFTRCPRSSVEKVLCRHCRDEYDTKLEEKRLRFESKEAISRLKNIRPGDL